MGTFTVESLYMQIIVRVQIYSESEMELASPVAQRFEYDANIKSCKPTPVPILSVYDSGFNELCSIGFGILFVLCIMKRACRGCCTSVPHLYILATV